MFQQNMANRQFGAASARGNAARADAAQARMFGQNMANRQQDFSEYQFAQNNPYYQAGALQGLGGPPPGYPQFQQQPQWSPNPPDYQGGVYNNYAAQQQAYNQGGGFWDTITGLSNAAVPWAYDGGGREPEAVGFGGVKHVNYSMLL